MAKQSALRSGADAGAVSFNMTPMIDCVFQLILFFLLASQVASQDLPAMELHRPHRSQAQKPEDVRFPYKVVVNVLSAREENNPDPVKAGKAKLYLVGGEKVAPNKIQLLERKLKKRWRETDDRHKKDFFIEIRADKDVHFVDVVPVMETAAKVGIVKMNITALAKQAKLR